MFRVNKSKSQSGFSIVEGLIATGIVAMSILAVGYMVNQTTKISDKARVKQEVPGAISDALNRARLMLLNTMDVTSGLRNRGICTMLEPQRVAAGIVPVDLVVNRATMAGNSLYLQSAWVSVYSPDWQVSQYAINSLGGISFTLRPTDVNPYIPTTGVDRKSVVSKVKITVTSMDPNSSSGIFGPLNSSVTRIDAKKAAYQIQTETAYVTVDQSGVRSNNSETGTDIVSVIDVGSCDIRDSAGNLFTLSPAGTGIGDPSGRSIYNNTEFTAPGQKPYEIFLLNREVTRGKFINNKLSADRNHDKTLACTESVFRCKQAGNNRQYRPFVNVNADVNYFTQSMFGFQERAQVIPQLELFAKPNGKDLLPGHKAVVEYTNFVRMSPDQDNVNYRRAPTGLYYPVDAQGNLIMTSPMSFSAGINRITATISNVQNMCSDICQPDYRNDIFARLKISSPNFRTTSNAMYEQSADSPQPLHCTMCWMKGCTRAGIQTFGSVNNMPDEPLDSQIPECAATEMDEARKHNPYRGITVDGTGSCLSGRIVNNQLRLTARSCNDSLPVMCFAFGHYTFAKQLSNNKAIISTTFANAPDACRNLGRERVLVADLNAQFASMGVSTTSLAQIPQVAGKYDFLNLAKVGSFTAPQGSAEISRAITSVQKEFGPAQASSDFWVALRQDITGIMADVPTGKTLNPADEQHMIYYSAAGVITHEILNQTPYSIVRQPGSSSGRAFVLFNHPKFRGVVATSTEQSNPLRFLCMRKSNRTYFVSSGVSTYFSSGGTACKSEGGIFIAPHTPRAWLQAMLSVAPHGDYLPFPELSMARNPVWIAYEQNQEPALQGDFEDLGAINGTEPVIDYAVYRDGSFVKASELTQEVAIEKEITRIEKDKDGKEITITETITEYETQPDPRVKFVIACFDADNLVINLRSEDVGCLGSEDRVLTSNIKKRNIALAWVLSKDKFNLEKKEFIRVK